LCARQNEGFLPPFPIWDDVRTFDGKPWRGIIDVVSGGFPCQDISAAGKGAGITGERSGMWKEMARIICEVRPRYAFVENSPMLKSRGLHVVLGDLAEMGYDAAWGVLGAHHVGANHKRDRMWIVGVLADAMPAGQRREQRQKETANNVTKSSDTIGQLADTSELQRNGSNDNGRISMEVEQKLKFRNHSGEANLADTKGAGFTPCFDEQGQMQSWRRSIGNAQWWQTEPDVGRVADGVAARVDRLKAIGNGQVPLCAATAFQILKQQLDKHHD
jgi:DNA (cytosine-5)-methyltransferase 1